ncbi:MAG: hypothetical protein K6E29_05090 [Cyanobacteria bacterium RUI128]|nr:hypothetical protein [Cyanobacteria bacterium RUI128]
MKNFILLSVMIFFAGSALAFYDFCESPADYNTCPQAYDVRTEYWKDIPNYHPDDIKYEDMKNEHPIAPFWSKKSKNNSKKTNDGNNK